MAAVKARQAELLQRSVGPAGATESLTATESAAEPTSTHAPWGMLKLDLRQASVAARESAVIDMSITPCYKNDRIFSVTRTYRHMEGRRHRVVTRPGRCLPPCG